jgi:hypothetical protein
MIFQILYSRAIRRLVGMMTMCAVLAPAGSTVEPQWWRCATQCHADGG